MLLLEQRYESGQCVGRGGECLDLLVRDLGEVAPEQLADARPVVLERDGTVVGQLDQNHTPVVGLPLATHQSLLFELLDEACHRWLSEPLELCQLGDPSWSSVERVQ